MGSNLLSQQSDKLQSLFSFIHDFGYSLSKSEMINEEEFKLTYFNEKSGKEIYISLCDSINTQRFFIVIAIIRHPYLSVHDFVSFKIYLDKNGIKHPGVLEFTEKNIDKAESYIKTYADLFKEYGIILIESKDQFPGYFPEWT